MGQKHRNYGDDKRDQVRTLVEYLFHLRGSSIQPRTNVGGIEIEYCDWNSSEPYLHVTQSTLEEIANRSSLTSDSVRESLNYYLPTHLGILTDRRKAKAGKNAGNWAFDLKLQSTDWAENKRKFDALWLAKHPSPRYRPEPEVEEKSFVPRPFVGSSDRENAWVGRDSLIAELLGKLQGQTRLLWITGISGVGKTALAECLASKFQNPDTSFHRVSFDGVQSQDFDAEKIWTGMGEKEFSTEERKDPLKMRDRLFKQLQAHPYWIQLDGLEQLLVADPSTEFADPYWFDFLQQCLASSQFRSRLVLTAQAFPTSMARFEDDYEQEEWHEITLTGLSGEGENSEHLMLFTRNGLTQNAENVDTLRRIGRIYEGHPLVLRVITKEILAKPFNGNVAKYWERHGDEFEQASRELQAQRVNPASYSEQLRKRVRQRIVNSLKYLSSDALALLCGSSVYRRSVPHTFWLAMIEDCSPIQQGDAYRVLQDRALVEREDTQNNDLICQHNLIRDVSYDLLRRDVSSWETAERKAADQWLAYQPAPDAPNLEKVRGYLEAFYHLCEVEDWEAAKEIFLTPLNTPTKSELYWQLGVWGFYWEQIRLCNYLSDKLDFQIKETVYNTLGTAHSYLNDDQQAINYYQKALDITRKIGNRLGEANILLNITGIYSSKGDYDKAIQYVNIASEIAESQYTSILFVKGNIYYYLGNYLQAQDCYGKHVSYARQIGDREEESKALGQLALVSGILNNSQISIVFFNEALNIAREVGLVRYEGELLQWLGVAYGKTGNVQESLECGQLALDIARKIGAQDNEYLALQLIGTYFSNQCEYKQAIAYYEDALIIARKIKHRRGEENILITLAVTYHNLDDLLKSLDYNKQAFDIAWETGDQLGQGLLLNLLGNNNIKLEDYQGASDNFQWALEIFQSIGNRAGEAEVRKNLATTHQRMGQLSLAREFCQQALMIATELDIPLAEECRKLKEELEKIREEGE